MAKIKATPEKVIALAISHVGYLEKASNSQLDDFGANVGSKNYTKFARDLDAVPKLFNGKKQGFAWCGVFVVWLFAKAFGVEAAKKLLCLPDNSLAAGCGYAARYYQAKGQFYKSNPKPGDQIFFLDSVGDVGHTGLVYKVDNRYVYTIEGNTSPQTGVVGNGGGVYKKQYALSDNRIYGYGRPDYDGVFYEVTEDTKDAFSLQMRVLKKGCSGDAVCALQMLLIGNGCSCGKWGADGNFGIATETAVKQYQQVHKLQIDGKAGPETWGCLLGAAS